MPEQVLGDLNVDAALPEQIRHAMAKRMPTKLLVDTDPLKRWPDVTSQDYIWL